jgi:hypothetical protein
MELADDVSAQVSARLSDVRLSGMAAHLDHDITGQALSAWHALNDVLRLDGRVPEGFHTPTKYTQAGATLIIDDTGHAHSTAPHRMVFNSPGRLQATLHHQSGSRR